MTTRAGVMSIMIVTVGGVDMQIFGSRKGLGQVMVYGLSIVFLCYLQDMTSLALKWQFETT